MEQDDVGEQQRAGQGRAAPQLSVLRVTVTRREEQNSSGILLQDYIVRLKYSTPKVGLSEAHPDTTSPFCFFNTRSVKSLRWNACKQRGSGMEGRGEHRVMLALMIPLDV